MKFILQFLLFPLVTFAGNPSLELTELQTEHLTKPLGIDSDHPRFSWKVKPTGDFLIQESFQLNVGTDSLAVSGGEGSVWTYTETGRNNLMQYSGKQLQPFTRYYWSVQITDQKGRVSNTAVSWFETGMMNMQNWEGEWISDGKDIDFLPAPYFRKEIELFGEVARARAYVTAAGYYELSVNGQKIGNHRLDPTYTRFDKRNLYVTHDLTGSLQNGKAAIGVILGNGWYNHQSTAVWNFHEAGWRNRPRLKANIHITYTDGRSEVIATDSSWKTSTGPIVFNSIYTAEHQNANLEQKGWNRIGFDDSDWKQAIVENAPSELVVAQALEPVRNTKSISPVSMRKINNSRYIFDLGRNISGVTELTVNGEKDTKIWVTHAEQLDENGEPDLSNIEVHYRPTDTLDPFQTDIYILDGNGEETFRPKFNYKGFQYVEVKSDQPIELTKQSITGQFLHSDVEPAGTIQTSNELINKIWKATNASYLSNLFGYPTDCPQREKNGWTGDAHINIETGLYNFDGISVYEKWMDDHRDEQQPNGVLPSIMPTWGWGYDWGNGPDWTSTLTIIPWEIYQFYGDDTALEELYEPIKQYVDHITEISDGSGLTEWGLGDWVPVQSETPKELTSSIYYYVDATILAKTAAHFGNAADAQKYSKLAKTIRHAINDKYLDEKTGIYGSGFQTELSAPLYWHVVPDSLRQTVADNLAEEVHQSNDHIDVGLLGSRTILGALSQNGYADLAYKLASQDTYPSWGWWIKNGATTLYENWDLEADSDISKNHIMFGAIGGWLYSGLGGILPDEQQPGFKHILLQPNIVTGLDKFEASYESPNGTIVSGWEPKGEQILYTATVPPNSTATLYLNGKKITYHHQQLKKRSNGEYKIQLKSGTYHFSISR